MVARCTALHNGGSSAAHARRLETALIALLKNDFDFSSLDGAAVISLWKMCGPFSFAQLKYMSFVWLAFGTCARFLRHGAGTRAVRGSGSAEPGNWHRGGESVSLWHGGKKKGKKRKKGRELLTCCRSLRCTRGTWPARPREAAGRQ